MDDAFLEGCFFEFVAELRDCVRSVCGQVDESLLLCLQLLELAREPRLCFFVCSEQHVDGFGDEIAKIIDGLHVEHLCRHQFHNLIFE
ncbi:MAG: hypothetical protein ACNYNX_10565 [Leucobacter sp.]